MNRPVAPGLRRRGRLKIGSLPVRANLCSAGVVGCARLSRCALESIQEAIPCSDQRQTKTSSIAGTGAGGRARVSRLGFATGWRWALRWSGLSTCHHDLQHRSLGQIYLAQRLPSGLGIAFPGRHGKREDAVLGGESPLVTRRSPDMSTAPRRRARCRLPRPAWQNRSPYKAAAGAGGAPPPRGAGSDNASHPTRQAEPTAWTDERDGYFKDEPRFLEECLPVMERRTRDGSRPLILTRRSRNSISNSIRIQIQIPEARFRPASHIDQRTHARATRWSPADPRERDSRQGNGFVPSMMIWRWLACGIRGHRAGGR